MKKYKLIKEYPDSPKLGFILEQKSGTVDAEKYPEFWQEIVEKQYEILSFKYNDNNVVDNKNISFSSIEEHFYRNINYYNKPVSIFSVKRLSDGEVFTIGDRIISYSTSKTIKSINIPKNTPNDIGFITTNMDGFFDKSFEGYQYLFEDKVEKVKKPLFTTEDGVEVFEGDKVHYLDKHYLTLKGDADAKLASQALKGSWLFYSSKEAAEEYILMNKPCLSMKDVLDIPNTSLAPNFTLKQKEVLKKLVKSKLWKD